MRAPSLWPREHGAYAELGFPLVSGLMLAGPSPPGVCLAVSAVMLFLAHEPLAVLSGMRGARRRHDTAGRAVRRLAFLLGAGFAVGLCGALLGGPNVRIALLAPLLPAAALLPSMLRRRQRSLAAEILIVAVFAGLAVPLVVSGGGSATLGWIAMGVWFASFGLGTIAVHGLKMHHKQLAAAVSLRGSALVLAAVALAGMLLSAAIGTVPVLAAIAVVPSVAVTAVIAAKPMHPRRLKLVGWSLVAANLVTLTCLLLI